jgi:hypothetical protein
MSLDEFRDAVTEFLTLTSPGPEREQETIAARHRLTAASKDADLDALTWAVTEMARAILVPHTQHCALHGMLSAEFVRAGVDPDIIAEPLFRRLRRGLNEVFNWLTKVRKEADKRKAKGPHAIKIPSSIGQEFRGLDFLAESAHCVVRLHVEAAPLVRKFKNILPLARDVPMMFPQQEWSNMPDLVEFMELLLNFDRSLSVLINASKDVEDRAAASTAVRTADKRINAETRDNALETLSEALRNPQLPETRLLTTCVEALVKQGGNATLCVSALLDRVSEEAARAKVFLDTCRSAVESEGLKELTDSQCVEQFAETVEKLRPSEAASWDSLEEVCQTAVNVMTASPEARQLVQGREELRERLASLGDLERAEQPVWLQLCEVLSI